MAAAAGDGEGALTGGGISVVACDVGALVRTAGSGRGGMSSSVPIVISLVSKVADRMW